MNMYAYTFDITGSKKYSLPLFYMNLKEGDILEENKINSFSLDVFTAAIYNSDSPCCMFRMKTKPSDQKFITGGSSMNYEVLFPPSAFVVKKVTKIKSPVSNSVQLILYDLNYLYPIENKFLTSIGNTMIK